MSDPAKNRISVCNDICIISEADSTASVTTCELSSLATLYSATNYNMTTNNYLLGTPFASNASLSMAVWDNNLQKGFTDGAKNCFFGTAFRVGYVGLVNEVKFFMTRFTRSNFVSRLVFQGSMDGKTYTNIFIVGNEIHEGWNYYTYGPGSELQYRFYRFYSGTAGGCLIGELSLRGIEVIQDATDSYTCKPQIILNNTIVANLTTSVTFQADLTPLLTSVSPLFGQVTGGDSVTFTGTNFVADETLYTILID